jgi:hypothetical protein
VTQISANEPSIAALTILALAKSGCGSQSDQNIRLENKKISNHKETSEKLSPSRGNHDDTTGIVECDRAICAVKKRSRDIMRAYARNLDSR